MECLCLHSKAVLEQKRQKRFWEALFSTFYYHVDCGKGIFWVFPVTTEEAVTGYPQAWLLLPSVNFCVAVPSC